MEGIIPLHNVKFSCTEAGREICATFFSYRPAHWKGRSTKRHTRQLFFVIGFLHTGIIYVWCDMEWQSFLIPNVSSLFVGLSSSFLVFHSPCPLPSPLFPPPLARPPAQVVSPSFSHSSVQKIAVHPGMYSMFSKLLPGSSFWTFFLRPSLCNTVFSRTTALLLCYAHLLWLLSHFYPSFKTLSYEIFVLLGLIHGDPTWSAHIMTVWQRRSSGIKGLNQPGHVGSEQLHRRKGMNFSAQSNSRNI